MKLKKMGSGGCYPRMGGCEPRIEDIIKLKKSGTGWLGSSRGSGRVG